MRIFVSVFNALYISVSTVLIGIALTLMGYSVWHALVAIGTGGNVVGALLSAIGLIVISMAVLDIGKYLIEEEVLRDRELRSAIEARQTLTKFMVITCIAVSLEAIVYISKVDSNSIEHLVYPAVLLLSAVVVMVGLGVYQKLSQAIEIKEKMPAAKSNAKGPYLTAVSRPRSG
jgi:hypothetical protein